jgi:hypothetical protein
MSTSPKVFTALSIAAVAAVSVLACFTQHERNVMLVSVPIRSVQIALVPLYRGGDAARNPGCCFRPGQP